MECWYVIEEERRRKLKGAAARAGVVVRWMLAQAIAEEMRQEEMAECCSELLRGLGKRRGYCWASVGAGRP